MRFFDVRRDLFEEKQREQKEQRKKEDFRQADMAE